jgi:hypothetical protein
VFTAGWAGLTLSEDAKDQTGEEKAARPTVWRRRRRRREGRSKENVDIGEHLE